MQEVILQVDWSSEKKKKKAIEMVSMNEEVKSFSVDDEKKRLTVVGDMDPVRLVMKMRKHCPAADIFSLKNKTPAAVQTPPPPERYPPSHRPDPHYWEPSAPPHWGDNSCFPPQPYPVNGPSYHPYPSNWGQPWPPSGGYYG